MRATLAKRQNNNRNNRMTVARSMAHIGSAESSAPQAPAHLHAVHGIVENSRQQQPGNLRDQRRREHLADHRELVLAHGDHAAEQPRQRTRRRRRLF